MAPEVHRADDRGTDSVAGRGDSVTDALETHALASLETLFAVHRR